MIEFSFHEDKKTVLIKKMVQLDEETFERFKNLCNVKNARFDPHHKEHTCTLNNVPEIFEELVNAGMKCYVSYEVREMIIVNSKKALDHLQFSKTRLKEMEKVLKKRGMRIYPYQRAGILWLTTRNRALLADQMGLGKTSMGLMAIPENSPVVVVCPKAAKNVWYQEAKTWRPDLKPYVFQGKGVFQWPKPGQLFIFNYDILPGSPPDNCPDDLILIPDELHYTKNIKSKRTKHFRGLKDAVLYKRSSFIDKVTGVERITLSHRENSGKVWGLTGTPMLNRPPELWTVLESLDLGDEAYGNWRNFFFVFNGEKSGKGFDWGNPKPEAASMLKKVCLRRERIDVMPELPTKTYQDINVDIDNKKLLKELNKLMNKMENEGIDLGTVSLEELKSNQVVFESMPRIRAMLARSKIPEMLEIVENYEENDERLIVFSAHRSPIDVLSKRPGWAVITGDTNSNDRIEIVKNFQEGKYKGLGATIQTAGVALTLTAAHNALFVDLAWTPAVNEQAEDRLCRIGQTMAVLITRLVCAHPIEQRVHELLTIKKVYIKESVEAAKVTKEEIDNYDQNQKINVIDAIARTENRPEDIYMNSLLKIQQTFVKNEQLQIPIEKKKPISRPPTNPAESWVEKALLTLSGLDGDKARIKNDVGFNRYDTVMGNSLAQQLMMTGKLTEKQWKSSFSICMKYQKQIGSPP